jgi:hypothetical protein
MAEIHVIRALGDLLRAHARAQVVAAERMSFDKPEGSHAAA